jgi:hypothetical protein
MTDSLHRGSTEYSPLRETFPRLALLLPSVDRLLF